MIISNFSTRSTKSHVTYSANFTFAHKRFSSTVWFEVPKKYQAPTFPVDAFFVAAYPLAVQLGEELTIAGTLSKKLAKNISKVLPQIGLNEKPVVVHAEKLVVRPRQKNATAQLFTLGVDSFFTLVDHLKKKPTAPHFLLFVNGYDIISVSQKLMQKTNQEIQATAKHFGFQPIIISTNLREVSEPIVSWNKYHGAGIASVGHLFTHLFSSLYFNSSTIHRERIPWGTSKLADGYWSSEALTCVPYGTDTERIPKIQAIVKSEHFEFIKKRLRVCWDNYGQVDAPFNCAICEKCLRTQIAISFFTKDSLPTFGPIHLDRIPSFKIKLNDRHHWVNLSRLSARYLGETSATFQQIQILLQKNHIDPANPYAQPFFVQLNENLRTRVRYWKQKIKQSRYSFVIA